MLYVTVYQLMLLVLQFFKAFLVQAFIKLTLAINQLPFWPTYSELAVWRRLGKTSYLISFQIFAVDVAELLSFWVFMSCSIHLCGMIPHTREPNCRSEGGDSTVLRNVRTGVSSSYTV
jgi:hypothetical protein